MTITLFVPCIANFFVIIKERGWKTALVIVGVVIFIALLVGGGGQLGISIVFHSTLKGTGLG